jgi:hypothetical protein
MSIPSSRPEALVAPNGHGQESDVAIAAVRAQKIRNSGKGTRRPAPAEDENRRQEGRFGRAQTAATGSTDCKAIVANRMLPLRLELPGE